MMSTREDMILLTLSEAMKLSGMEGWSLTPKEEKFLIKSTTNLVNRNGKEWVIKHQARLRDEFEMISKETGLKIAPSSTEILEMSKDEEVQFAQYLKDRQQQGPIEDEYLIKKPR